MVVLGTGSTKGIVTGISTTVGCELKINTWSTATTSTELWYQAKATVNVDPTNSLKYQSFLGLEAGKPMIGMTGALDTFEVGDTGIAINVFLFLASIDTTTTQATGKRMFPLVPEAAARGDLTFTAYGANLKTAATFTATIPPVARFPKGNAEQNANNFDTASEFALLAATYATLASDSTLSTGGLVGFKVAQANWGGSCCATTCPTDQPAGDVVNKCNLAAGTAGNKLGLFMVNGANQIAHSGTDLSPNYAAEVGSSKINLLVGVAFTGLLDMPATTLTTVRGRGGFGASNQ